MSNLEEEVIQIVRAVLDDYSFQDIVDDAMSNSEVMTKGDFDPSDYDILNEDEVNDRIENTIKYKVEEIMERKISEFDQGAHDNELIPLVDRIEKLEDKLLAIHRLLGHTADVITYLSSFQKEDTNEL